ncbi:MAG: hypothetical protein AB7Q97_00960 [Gammaproteobacteria bacterium]
MPVRRLHSRLHEFAARFRLDAEALAARHPAGSSGAWACSFRDAAGVIADCVLSIDAGSAELRHTARETLAATIREIDILLLEARQRGWITALGSARLQVALTMIGIEVDSDLEAERRRAHGRAAAGDASGNEARKPDP